jgi:hypothetical protein
MGLRGALDLLIHHIAVYAQLVQRGLVSHPGNKDIAYKAEYDNQTSDGRGDKNQQLFEYGHTVPYFCRFLIFIVISGRATAGQNKTMRSG